MAAEPAAATSAEVEAADAWLEYLELTRGLAGSRYEVVEPWAWVRLRTRLRQSRRRHR